MTGKEAKHVEIMVSQNRECDTLRKPSYLYLQGRTKGCLAYFVRMVRYMEVKADGRGMLHRPQQVMLAVLPLLYVHISSRYHFGTPESHLISPNMWDLVPWSSMEHWE